MNRRGYDKSINIVCVYRMKSSVTDVFLHMLKKCQIEVSAIIIFFCSFERYILTLLFFLPPAGRSCYSYALNDVSCTLFEMAYLVFYSR